MSNQWKLVPVEPTETMVINGFESEPDECFSDEEAWGQYQEMSGCQQAAFRAKLCWAAMLAAAPVPQQADLDRVTTEQLAPVAADEMDEFSKWTHEVIAESRINGVTIKIQRMQHLTLSEEKVAHDAWMARAALSNKSR